MPILNSFLGVQPPKTRMNKGFLSGGGGIAWKFWIDRVA